jgi:copper resistance protein D
MNMPHMYSHVLIQWLNFLGIVLLVGGVVFRWAVLDRSLEVLDPASPELASAKAASHRDLKRLIGGCLILLGIVSFIDLVLRVQMMSGKPLSAVPAILPLVLFQTHIGKVWIAKMAILGLLSGIWFLMKEKRRSGEQPFLLLISAGLCLIVSLSGHAADQGNFSVALLADWLHVIAVSSWAGGLVPLRFLLPRIMEPLDEKSRLRLVTAGCRHFSKTAVRCVAILILTGIYNTWLHVATIADFVSTTYGITLMLKIALVAAMLGLGALSRYYILPSLQKRTGQSPRQTFIGRLVNGGICLLAERADSLDSVTLQRRFKTFVAVECLFALCVLGLTAFLTQTSPPHQTGFTAPGTPSNMQNMGM